MIELGWVTLSGTGNQAYAGLTAMPQFLEIILSQEGGAADSVTRYAIGGTDGTLERCDSIYADTTGGDTEKFTNRTIVGKSRVSGNIVKTLEASIVSFDNNGGGDYGFTLDQQTCTQGFQVAIKAYS